MPIGSANSVSRRHVPALDGLRALAVLGVLAFHDDRLPGGFLGVDLFFVLSGYLITGLLISDDATTLRRFWAQRLRRLIPSVLVVIVVVLIVFRSAGDPSEWILARRDAPWAQFYGANWHQIWLGTDYWSQFTVPSPFEHLWSLAIEEQFYLLWPIAVLGLLRRRSPLSVTWVAAVLTALSGLVMWVLSSEVSVTRVYMGTDTRAMGLVFGAFLATPAITGITADLATRFRRSISAWCFVPVVLVGALWFTVEGGDSWLFRGGLQVHSLLSGLVIIGVAHSQGPVSRVLALRPLVIIGKLSYALYLWHWPVYVFLSEERSGLEGWSLTGLRLAVTAIFSVASYVLIENPVRFRVRATSGRRGLAVFAGAMALTTSVWLAIPIPRTTNAVTETALSAALTTTSTVAPPESFDVTPRWTDVDLRNAYYLGDSIASDMWPAVEAGFTASGVAITSGAFGGVGIVGSTDNVDPLGTLEQRLQELSPDVVILQLSVWDAEEPAAAQVAALEELLRLVRRYDTHVVLLSFPPLSSERTRPGQDLLELRARDVAATSDGWMAYLDLREALGREFAFDIDRDGIPERKPDGIHVCPTGALTVTIWLLDQMETLVPTFAASTDTSWTTSDWITDERYDSPPGACAR
ncbi:MAG: acyltransferase family protein, partial [Actinomycetota bacterium]